MDVREVKAPSVGRSEDLEIIEKACALLDESEAPLSLESLSAALGHGPSNCTPFPQAAW